MTRPEALNDVSRTALAVAMVRARESARPHPLFDDPYAAAFLTAAGADASTEPDPASDSLAAGLTWHVLIRTRFYDDCLLAACEDDVRQVVLIAAGLDTRAFRLPWPAGVRVFELDLPPMLAFKDRVLGAADAVPRCERFALPADMARDDWPARLVEAGLDPDAPTAWLVEGLLIYLSADEVAGLLGGVGSLSAPGSRLHLERGADTAGPGSVPSTDPAARITSLWKGGLGADTGGWLREHGWTTEEYDSAKLAADYGHPRVRPAGTGFLTARRV